MHSIIPSWLQWISQSSIFIVNAQLIFHGCFCRGLWMYVDGRAFGEECAKRTTRHNVAVTYILTTTKKCHANEIFDNLVRLPLGLRLCAEQSSQANRQPSWHKEGDNNEEEAIAMLRFLPCFQSNLNKSNAQILVGTYSLFKKITWNFGSSIIKI